MPVALATDPAAPASSGRHVRSRRGIRSTPARLRPRMIRMTPPTWRSIGRYSEKPAAGERRGDAEQREHRPEARDVGEGVAEGEPAARAARRAMLRLRRRRRPRSAGRGRPGRGAGRTARGSSAGPPRPRRGSSDRRRSRQGAVEAVVEEAAQLRDAEVASSRRRPRSSTTGIRSKSSRSIAGSAAMSRSRRWAMSGAARGPVLEQPLDHLPRLVAQPAAGARVEDEVGEGSGGHLARHSRRDHAGGPAAWLSDAMNRAATMTKGLVAIVLLSVVAACQPTSQASASPPSTSLVGARRGRHR